MKFNFNLKYFISGFIIVLLINYNTFIPEKTTNLETTSNSSVKVELGDIKKTIEVSGDSQLVDEQSLKFNKSATITKVYFKSGDKIKKGEIIAEIDNSDAYDTIDEAKINLENAEISLKQLYEDPDETNVLQSKNSITSAENSLETAKAEIENLKVSQQNSLTQMLENIETSKKDLESSKSSLELSKKDLEILIKDKGNSLNNTNSSKSTTITSIEDNFRTYLVDVEKTIEEGDVIMGVTDKNRDLNNSFEIYLGAKNSTYKNSASINLSEAIGMYDNVSKEIANYDNSGDKDKLLGLLNDFLSLYNKMYDATDFIYKTLDNSVVSEGALSQSIIDSLKNSFSSYRNSALSKISTINSSINTLNTLTDTDLLSETNSNSIASKKESIKTSELSIEKQLLSIKNAQSSYDETVSSFKVNLDSKQKDLDLKDRNLELAKLNYDKLFEGPTDENVKKANNSIKQAQLKLDSAYKNLEDYTLVAPFDGVIRKIDYMVGDNLTTDTDKYVYIENPNLLEITVLLDQIDIVGVKLGMNATITFDAYSTTPVNAIISSIDTTPISTSGVVSYEVKLVLDDENFKEKILSGFSADVEIITESKQGILLLKTSAISEKDGKYFVNLIKDGKQVETEIEIGIASDGMTEIISGLNEGDEISLTTYVSTTTTEEKTSTSLFSTPTGNRSGNMSGPPGGF
ncbi:MAG: efflux RND transporter periplasmic adaptor subunit [Candidatus Gracilibacteria bacterium]|nr:efflux RND transporter periplasmic adaptor subunit [Candidatus Gracilibacteria bacterium]